MGGGSYEQSAVDEFDRRAIVQRIAEKFLRAGAQLLVVSCDGARMPDRSAAGGRRFDEFQRESLRARLRDVDRIADRSSGVRIFMPVRIVSGADLSTANAEIQSSARSRSHKIFRAARLRSDTAGGRDELCRDRSAGVLRVHLPRRNARGGLANARDSSRVPRGARRLIRVEDRGAVDCADRLRDGRAVFLSSALSIGGALQSDESLELLSIDGRRKKMRRLRTLCSSMPDGSRSDGSSELERMRSM